MDLTKIKEEKSDDGRCGGFKHCADKTFDREDPDCQECLDDYFGALEDLNRMDKDEKNYHTNKPFISLI